jgi:pilus assembly protein CpaC
VVSGQAAEDLEADVNRAFPNSYVKIEEVGAKWVVSGQARDSAELGQILDLLAKSRGGRSVIDRPTGVIQASDASITEFGLPLQQLAAAEAVAVIDTAALNDANIVNLMTIPGEQQVMLRVTVAEVNRNAARSVGLNFNALADSGGRFSNTTGNITGNILAVLDGGDINLRIEALRRLSLSRTLAEPNLVAINGQAATFQAGGQFPIPVIAAGGAANNLQGVQFVPFGVQLNFMPQIQDRDMIRLRVQANVSTRDEALGTNIGGGGGGGGGGGTAVPGLNSRNFATTVELRSGQTLAVAGLLQTNFGASSDRIPLWGDLPLLGFTGGVNRTSAAEQELVILVTPELVAPLDACAIPALPGHDVHEPTDIEFYLANRLESRRSRDFRSPVRTDYPKMRMPDKCCPDRYLVGGVGPTDRCCNQPAAVPHQPLPARRVAVPPAVDNSLMYEEVAP